MTEVLLLRVPSTGDEAPPVDAPISQGLVAAALRREGIGCDVLDLSRTGEAGLEEYRDALDDDDLLVVGMSAYQSNLERCLRLAELCRRLRPDVRVVLGGPQATHMPPAGLAAMPMVDGLCRGPGERAVVLYVEALRRGEEVAPGWLVRTAAGEIEEGPPASGSGPPGPSPYLAGVWPPGRYPLAVTFASRGCPYGCAFCYTPAASGRRWAGTPEAQVLAEVELLAAAGVPQLFFADPIFVVDRGRALRLLRALRDLDSGLAFTCELRMEHVDAELLAAFAEAGFIRLSYGLETVQRAVLTSIGKPTDLDRFRRVVEETLGYGIGVELFAMYGLPGQSLEDVFATFDFIAGFGPAVASAAEPQQLQLYFGIELLDRPERFGIEILGERPPYFSPGTSFRTASMGPPEFLRLEEEWRRRSGPARRRVGVPAAAAGPGA